MTRDDTDQYRETHTRQTETQYDSLRMTLRKSPQVQGLMMGTPTSQLRSETSFTNSGKTCSPSTSHKQALVKSIPSKLSNF